MDKELPTHVPDLQQTSHPRRPRKRASPRRWSLALLFLLFLTLNYRVYSSSSRWTAPVPLHAAQTLARCRALKTRPGPAPSFLNRTQSDRFQAGTKPVLLRNATIWTGRVKGLEVVKGDVLLDQGLIKAFGVVPTAVLQAYGEGELQAVDVKGAWVTPGIIDVHSHMGNGAAPALDGASDGNSLAGLTLPYLRSVDGLNTHDLSYQHSIAGGLTTALVLPGSADAIGGQAFVMKLRPTEERSTTSLLLEPPLGLNGSEVDWNVPPRWRHIKHACGENPARVYSGTRMDTVWSQRSAYNEARKIKDAQDAYCAAAESGRWPAGEFPDSLQWESLVDVLNGKVKVQTHCYEAVDLDAFIRLSNEFKFPVAAFHHAHEAYLVPDLLKKAYEHPPAVAIFSEFSRYKREAMRASHFAARILADNGLNVVFKSDHSAIVSRYLLHEAQQAHYYGLVENVALSSVISGPAAVLGLEHRIGFIREGYDADVVVWDSHPLALGATPTQVYIDGIPQIKSPVVNEKPASQQKAPSTPDFDQEVRDTIKYEGLPPLAPKRASADVVVFQNVSQVFVRTADGVEEQDVSALGHAGVVIAERGRVTCMGACVDRASDPAAMRIDLRGGSLAPGLVSYGSELGLQEISMEPSTTDGTVYDPLTESVPSILGKGSVIRAVDGLQFGTRNALLAYKAGVTTSITPPSTYGFLAGLSTAFSTAAPHKLALGAVVQNVTALCVNVGSLAGGTPSVSTQIAALRRVLLGQAEGELGSWGEAVAKGEIPLVVSTHKADIIASLVALKNEAEAAHRSPIRLTLVGATEAHLLAKELAAADVGVVVTPPRSFPYIWDAVRYLPGPPLTELDPVSALVVANVTVAIGPQGLNLSPQMSPWAVQNLRFDAGWVQLQSQGLLSKADAIALASSNVEKLLGVNTVEPEDADLVATVGGDILSMEGKVVAVMSPRRGVVDLL